MPEPVAQGKVFSVNDYRTYREFNGKCRNSPWRPSSPPQYDRKHLLLLDILQCMVIVDTFPDTFDFACPWKLPKGDQTDGSQPHLNDAFSVAPAATTIRTPPDPFYEARAHDPR